MISSAYTAKSLSNFFFGLAIISFMIGIGFSYIPNYNSHFARDWGNLIGIILVLTALFILIRDSKPIFTKFPISMTFFPLSGIFFFPLMMHTDVVKDLLLIIYQGGAILVGLLIISVNKRMYKTLTLFVLSSLLFVSSFLLNWFIEYPMADYKDVISKLLVSGGIFSGAIGFKTLSLQK